MEVDFPPSMDPYLLDLLSKLLQKNPENRAPIIEIKGHAWITNFGKQQMPDFKPDEIKVTEDDKKNVFTLVSNLSTAVMKLKKKVKDNKKRRKN